MTIFFKQPLHYTEYEMEHCSVLRYKNIIPKCHRYTFRSLTWIIQDAVSSGTSLGPSTLHGQIQMSAVWGKICGQIPQRGDSRSVQMPHLCPYPPPLLRLNIGMCIKGNFSK